MTHCTLHNWCLLVAGQCIFVILSLDRSNILTILHVCIVETRHFTISPETMTVAKTAERFSTIVYFSFDAVVPCLLQLDKYLKKNNLC